MNDRNPYAPPKAPVQDNRLPEGVGPCRDVVRACTLLWLGFAVTVAGDIVDTMQQWNDAEVNFLLIGLAIALGFGTLITWWITSRLRLGRNWMRWLYTIVNVGSLLIILALWNQLEPVLRMLYTSPLLIMTAVLQGVLIIGAIALLFTRSSREWFDARRSYLRP